MPEESPDLIEQALRPLVRFVVWYDENLLIDNEPRPFEQPSWTGIFLLLGAVFFGVIYYGIKRRVEAVLSG